MDFDISRDFNTLTLRGKNATTATTNDCLSKFHLFPTLPTELRLKIISHALPLPTTLKITANPVIADPSFGLYLVFQLTSPRLPTPSNQIFGFGGDQARAPRKWYVEARSLNLLATNREFRDYYIEHFPYALPSGFSAPWIEGGLIRYSAHDALMFRNFAPLAAHGRVVLRAINEGWRLQSFWEELKELHVRIEVAGSEYIDGCAETLARMRGLKGVRVWLWRGFGEDQAEGVRVQFERAMGERVRLLEGMVKEQRERGKIEGDEEVVMPEFKLMGLC